jgi:hypothetical protein
MKKQIDQGLTGCFKRLGPPGPRLGDGDDVEATHRTLVREEVAHGRAASAAHFI